MNISTGLDSIRRCYQSFYYSRYARNEVISQKNICNWNFEITTLTEGCKIIDINLNILIYRNQKLFKIS